MHCEKSRKCLNKGVRENQPVVHYVRKDKVSIFQVRVQNDEWEIKSLALLKEGSGQLISYLL